jgi:hypothetical protein
MRESKRHLVLLKVKEAQVGLPGNPPKEELSQERKKRVLNVLKVMGAVGGGTALGAGAGVLTVRALKSRLLAMTPKSRSRTVAAIRSITPAIGAGTGTAALLLNREMKQQLRS